MKYRHLCLIPLAAISLAVSGCTATTSKHTTRAAASKHAAAPAHATKVRYDGKDGSTALDLLRQHAKVKTQHSSLGEYVTSIDGLAATKSRYWMFYVNGAAATKGADAYQTHNGQRIEWRYES